MRTYSIRFLPAVSFCLVLLAIRGANAAVVIDPLGTGATDVALDVNFVPQALLNPLADPFDADAPSTVLIIGRNGAGTLEASSGGKISARQIWQGLHAGSVGNLFIDGAGSTVENVSEIRVGLSGNGELAITNGGSVTSSQLYVSANDELTSSTVRIDGADSTLTLEYGMYAGFGEGTVLVETTGGGQFIAESAEVGSYSGNQTQAVVSGADSKWSIAGDLFVGRNNGHAAMMIAGGGEIDAGSVYLGQPLDGNPAVVTLDGGTLRAGVLYMGSGDIAGTGTVYADGLVADLPLAFDATHGLQQQIALGANVMLQLDHTSAATLGAGFKSSGSLSMTDGRQVHSAAGLLGHDAGSLGQASISGPGTTWTIDGDLIVGLAGAGKLTVGTGATVTVGGELRLSENSAVDASFINLTGGQLDVGTLRAAPSQLRGTGTIRVDGYHTDGQIVFDDPNAMLGSVVLDDLPGQQVTIEFDPNAIGLLGVGYKGEGLLHVRNGAKLHTGRGALGAEFGSHGTATIEGAGSEWIVDQTLDVGSETSDGRGTLRVLDGARVESDAVIVRRGSSVEVAGADSHFQSDHLEFRSQANNSPILIEIQDGAKLTTRQAFSSTFGSQFDVIRVSGENSAWRIEQMATMRNTMLHVADGGAVIVGTEQGPAGELDLQQGILHLDGGMVDMQRGQLRISQGQALIEEGTLRNFSSFQGDLWQVGGRMELEVGPANITGRYILDSDATLALRLFEPGIQNPALTVNGPALISGTLDVAFAEPDNPRDEYTPRAGDRFTLVRSHSGIAGDFNELILPDLPGSLSWTVERTSQELWLRIVGGDYNGNGVVDAADYTVWRDTLGSTTNLAANSNGNTVIDTGDYHIWRSNFGALQGNGANAAAPVPEPAALLLLLAAVAGFAAPLAAGRGHRRLR